MTDDLRPDQDDEIYAALLELADDYLLPCPDCGRCDCLCDAGPSYLVEEYVVWDLVGGSAW